MFILGDAIEVMSSFDDNSFDAVVTSPPYNIGVDYGHDVDDNKSQQDYNLFTENWIRESLRISPVCIVNFGAPTSKPMNIANFMMSASKSGIIQSDIIWLKSVSTETFSIGHFKPVNSTRFITNLVEHVFVISRNGDFKIDRLSVGVPFKDKSNIKRFSSNKGDLRCRGNVWLLPYKTRNEKLSHPATFPVELAEMMIKISGGLRILDPFCGIGTTGTACNNLGIDYVGIDLREWT